MNLKLTIYFDVLIFSFLGLTVYAQNPNLPDGRTSGILTYHPPSKSMLLIDGYQIHPDNNQNKVWSWDGKQWKMLAQKGPNTILPAMGYDPISQTILLYGGDEPGNKLSSTLWQFKDDQWVELANNGKWHFKEGKYQYLPREP